MKLSPKQWRICKSTKCDKLEGMECTAEQCDKGVKRG